MICPTKSGILVEGTLSKEPEVKNAGSKQVLKLNVLYGHEEAAAQGARRAGKFLDVDVWNDVALLDGMLHKGDDILVTGEKIKQREWQGKTYYSIDAAGLYPTAGSVLRWMQEAIDMMQASIPPAPAAPDIAAPPPAPTAQQEPTSTQIMDDYPPIDEDEGDLPF